MALIKRMKEGDRTPTLYTWYDKQYNFDNLLREADYGLEEYINTLKRGDKDKEKFRLAYYDIMSGIKDGSITFKNGRYIDSTGKYTNGIYYDLDGNLLSSKKKSKDYYGLMANYIYGKQRSLNEYIAPEDKTKIKWDGSSSIGNAITRHIFNSDTWNNQDFQDLNEYDKSGKVKGPDNRYKKLYDAFDYVLKNFDTLFSGYSELDKTKATLYISEAMDYLKDGEINHGDYLALNRAASGLDYRSMFSDRTVETPTVREEVALAPETDFISWVSRNYPIFSEPLRPSKNLNDNRLYRQDTLNKITQAVNSLSANELYRIIHSALTDPNYHFNNEPFIIKTFKDANGFFSNPFGVRLALQSLKNKNLLKSFGGEQSYLYYIPTTDNKKRLTSWVWDEKNGTLSEMSYHDIPYWREKILAEWLSLKRSGDNTYYTSRYGSFKEGGVILAQKGVRLSKTANWYTGVFLPLLDRILEGLKKDPNYHKWLNGMLDSHLKLYAAASADGADFLNRAYTSSDVGAYLDLYKSGYNNEWGSNSAGYNSLGINNAWEKGMFDISGGTRTSGDWSGMWATDNMFSGITDYRRILGRDNDFGDLLDNIKSKFNNAGYDFYKDENGYYKLKPIEAPVEEPKKQDESGEENPEKKQSFINPTSTKSPNSSGNFLSQLAPNLIGAGRLFSSLRTNNRVAETVRKSLIPVLKNTHELYSPITGAFSEMLLRNNLAANIRRLVTRPFTSDASLQLAGALEANRQATDLERQGFLADDAEIKRTKAEALRRLEDNITRRSEVDNFNRASINQANRDLALLEAAKLKQNSLSIDNFLQGIENRARTKYEANKQRRDNFRLQTAVSDIDSQYLDAIHEASRDIRKWQADNPNVDITTAGTIYDDYINKVRELLKWRSAQTLGAYAGVYGDSYNNPYLSKTPLSILGRVFKNGGTLNPSIQYLIRKVIRNENNT